MTDRDRPALPAFPASRGPNSAKRLASTLTRLEQARDALLGEIERAEQAFLAAVEDRAAADDNRSRVRELAAQVRRDRR